MTNEQKFEVEIMKKRLHRIAEKSAEIKTPDEAMQYILENLELFAQAAAFVETVGDTAASSMFGRDFVAFVNRYKKPLEGFDSSQEEAEAVPPGVVNSSTSTIQPESTATGSSRLVETELKSSDAAAVQNHSREPRAARERRAPLASPGLQEDILREGGKSGYIALRQLERIFEGEGLDKELVSTPCVIVGYQELESSEVVIRKITPLEYATGSYLPEAHQYVVPPAVVWSDKIPVVLQKKMENGIFVKTSEQIQSLGEYWTKDNMGSLNHAKKYFKANVVDRFEASRARGGEQERRQAALKFEIIAGDPDPLRRINTIASKAYPKTMDIDKATGDIITDLLRENGEASLKADDEVDITITSSKNEVDSTTISAKNMKEEKRVKIKDLARGLYTANLQKIEVHGLSDKAQKLFDKSLISGELPITTEVSERLKSGLKDLSSTESEFFRAQIIKAHTLPTLIALSENYPELGEAAAGKRPLQNFKLLDGKVVPGMVVVEKDNGDLLCVDLRTKEVEVIKPNFYIDREGLFARMLIPKLSMRNQARILGDPKKNLGFNPSRVKYQSIDEFAGETAKAEIASIGDNIDFYLRTSGEVFSDSIIKPAKKILGLAQFTLIFVPAAWPLLVGISAAIAAATLTEVAFEEDGYKQAKLICDAYTELLLSSLNWNSPAAKAGEVLGKRIKTMWDLSTYMNIQNNVRKAMGISKRGGTALNLSKQVNEALDLYRTMNGVVNLGVNISVNAANTLATDTSFAIVDGIGSGRKFGDFFKTWGRIKEFEKHEYFPGPGDLRHQQVGVESGWQIPHENALSAIYNQMETSRNSSGENERNKNPQQSNSGNMQETKSGLKSHYKVEGGYIYTGSNSVGVPVDRDVRLDPKKAVEDAYRFVMNPSLQNKSREVLYIYMSNIREIFGEEECEDVLLDIILEVKKGGGSEPNWLGSLEKAIISKKDYWKDFDGKAASLQDLMRTKSQGGR